LSPQSSVLSPQSSVLSLQSSVLSLQSRFDRRASFFHSPFFEREARPILLRHFHAVFTDLARNQRDVTEVGVDVIVGILSVEVTVTQLVHVVAQIFGDVVVLLDRLSR